MVGVVLVCGLDRGSDWDGWCLALTFFFLVSQCALSFSVCLLLLVVCLMTLVAGLCRFNSFSAGARYHHALMSPSGDAMVAAINSQCTAAVFAFYNGTSDSWRSDVPSLLLSNACYCATCQGCDG